MSSPSIQKSTIGQLFSSLCSAVYHDSTQFSFSGTFTLDPLLCEGIDEKVVGVPLLLEGKVHIMPDGQISTHKLKGTVPNVGQYTVNLSGYAARDLSELSLDVFSRDPNWPDIRARGLHTFDGAYNMNVMPMPNRVLKPTRSLFYAPEVTANEQIITPDFVFKAMGTGYLKLIPCHVPAPLRPRLELSPIYAGQGI